MTSTLLFHSKYSKHSENLTSLLSKYDLLDSLGVKKVCIDNDKIRKQIIDNNNIDLKFIPCVILLHPDGRIDKYEGGDAFAWANDLIVRQVEIIKQQQATQQATQEIRQLTQETRQTPPLQESTQNFHELQQQQQQQQHQQHLEPQQQPTNSTSLAEVGDDTDEVHPPKTISVRSGPGSFELSNDFGSREDDTRIVKKGIKPVSELNGTKDRNDVMAAALAMQKMRETQETQVGAKQPII